MLDCWGAFHTGVGRAHAVYLILLTLFGSRRNSLDVGPSRSRVCLYGFILIFLILTLINTAA
jgi:hypothetical protein